MTEITIIQQILIQHNESTIQLELLNNVLGSNKLNDIISILKKTSVDLEILIEKIKSTKPGDKLEKEKWADYSDDDLYEISITKALNTINNPTNSNVYFCNKNILNCDYNLADWIHSINKAKETFNKGIQLSTPGQWWYMRLVIGMIVELYNHPEWINLKNEEKRYVSKFINNIMKENHEMMNYGLKIIWP